MKKIAIVTQASQNMGMGHLIRMTHLYNGLKSDYNLCFFLFGNPENFIYLGEKEISFKHVLDTASLLEEIKSYAPDLILHDMRNSNKERLLSLFKIAKVITFDDAGECSFADVVINPLPLPKEKEVSSNFSGIKYLILNPEIKKYKKIYLSGRVSNILVTFGGSDPADLTNYVYRIFRELGLDANIRFVLGPLYSGTKDVSPYESVSTDNIFEHLKWADIVITSFGMTLYEALYIGAFPLLINASPYHNELSKTLDFNINLGVGGDDADFDRIKKGIKSAIEDVNRRKSVFNISKSFIDDKGILRIKEIIDKEINKEKAICSVCKNNVLEVADRKGKDNIYFCTSCKTLCRHGSYCALINLQRQLFSR